MGDAAAMRRCARIVQAQRAMRPVVVVSALGGFTDALVASVAETVAGEPEKAMVSLDAQFERHENLARELLGPDADGFLPEISAARSEVARLIRGIAAQPAARPRLEDEVLAMGERLSSTLFSAVLGTSGLKSKWVDARRCIVTDEEHGRAGVLLHETQRRVCAEIVPIIHAPEIPVLGGFIGATSTGITTTLGRGGSDYTAALLGAALAAREIQIWTDVPGVMTADPRVVPAARPIPRLSYPEAAELAYFGAKVIHPKTIQPAVEKSIPIRICNSITPERPGTLVSEQMEKAANGAKAIAFKPGITTVRVSSAGMLGAFGFLRALFEIFDCHRVVVDVVATSEVSVSLSIEDASVLPAILPELEALGSVSVEQNRAIVCVVGEGLQHTSGVAARVFSALGDINVSMISQGASSINLTFVVEGVRVESAVRRLHKALWQNPDREGGV